MRIAILTQSYPPMVSGAAIAAQRLAEGLGTRGHQVLVMTASSDGNAFKGRESGYDLVRFASHPNPLRAEQRFAGWPHRRMLRELHAFDPDVVQLFDPLAFALTGLQYARRTATPLLLTLEQLPWFITASLPGLSRFAPWVEGASWAYYRWLMQRCSAVVAPTETITGIIETQTGIPALAISNGVDLLTYTPSHADPKESRVLRFRLGVPPGAPIILYVGRLDLDKRVERVLEGAAGAMPGNDAHLVVVGDGTQRESLLRRATELGIDSRCHFTGFIREPASLARLYRLARVFVNASEIETQGITLLEASACGTPIVAVRATCVPEIVRHGVNGFLVSSGDSEGMSKAIAALLTNAQLARNMGQAGALAAQAHALPLMVSNYERLALRLTARHYRRPASRAVTVPVPSKRSGAPD